MFITQVDYQEPIAGSVMIATGTVEFVIIATGTMEFEDGLMMGVLPGGCWVLRVAASSLGSISTPPPTPPPPGGNG